MSIDHRYLVRLALIFAVLCAAIVAMSDIVRGGWKPRAPTLSAIEMLRPASLEALTIGRDGALIGPDGRPVPVSGRLAGYLEKIEITDGTAVLSGWARDVWSSAPAASIAAFVEGRRYSMTARTAREDVAETFREPASLLTGFEIRVPAAELGSGRNVEVHACDWTGGCGVLRRHPDVAGRR